MHLLSEPRGHQENHSVVLGQERLANEISHHRDTNWPVRSVVLEVDTDPAGFTFMTSRLLSYEVETDIICEWQARHFLAIVLEERFEDL